MIINQLFKAHPVGQGFFYTGKILANQASFSFIFDCGSLSYKALEETIDRFRFVNDDDDIDLDVLIISHFDADHINGLKKVLGTRKVKKIIAPFIGFNERLTLALRFANEIEGSDLDNDTTIALQTILDFTLVLENSINENTEIYFITDSDKGSASPTEEPEFIPKELDILDHFEFQFENSDDLTPKEITDLKIAVISAKIKKINCSQKAFLSIGSNFKIMDFIFYKKKIGENEQLFYGNIFDLFIEKNSKEFKDSSKPEPNEIIDAIKKLKGAGTIKELFEKAAKKITHNIPVNDLKNLNTTALSMLHSDRLLKALQNTSNSDNGNLFLKVKSGLSSIQIFKNKELQLNLNESYNGFHYRYNRFFGIDNHFSPNTILTSDSFLKKNDDVIEFIKHYKFFWKNLSIFQIPHHGSGNSSDKTLFSKIPVSKYKFINYGVNHNFIQIWSHPHECVINDLVATGHSNKLLPINEHTGYEMNFELHIRRI